MITFDVVHDVCSEVDTLERRKLKILSSFSFDFGIKLC